MDWKKYNSPRILTFIDSWFVVCGEIGHYRLANLKLAQWRVGCPNMTEKLLTFPSSTPPPSLLPPETLGMGSIGQKSTFFQKIISTNQQRHLYRDNMRGSRNLLSGGGGGSMLLNLFYSIYTEGVQWFYYTFSRGSNLFQADPNANFYRNPYNYNLWFSRGGGGGVWTPYPPSGSVKGQCGILARICAASF